MFYVSFRASFTILFDLRSYTVGYRLQIQKMHYKRHKKDHLQILIQFSTTTWMKISIFVHLELRGQVFVLYIMIGYSFVTKSALRITSQNIVLIQMQICTSLNQQINNRNSINLNRILKECQANQKDLITKPHLHSHRYNQLKQ